MSEQAARPHQPLQEPQPVEEAGVRADVAVAIGGSAGAIGVLLELVRDLPADLPAALLVVVHVPSNSRSVLPRLLAKASGLPCRHALGGEFLLEGHAYVAPPDFHMSVSGGRIVLDRGARENRNRPAIDPLFRSIASEFGFRGMGVLLSGILDDGVMGLAKIERAGGVTVVQDPADALYAEMPAAALRALHVDHTAAGSELGKLLGRLVADLKERTGPLRLVEGTLESWEHGQPSDLSCPDCGGVLRQTEAHGMPYYVCHVGHAYLAETLAEAQDERVEQALWRALRALRERAEGARRLASRFERVGEGQLVERYRRRVMEAERDADLIRSVLEKRKEPRDAIHVADQHSDADRAAWS